jgi:tetratricopeptide (TPR) repeat protein
MAGKIFTLLPAAGAAFRMNLFSAVLSLIVLVMMFFILRLNMESIFQEKAFYLPLLGVFIVAFSGIFWNQAIEAKGGIYIMNLLFVSAILFLSLLNFRKYDRRYMYMIFYLYGLSLTNHWPSMAVLLPIVVYMAIKYRKQTVMREMAACVLFFLLGLSAYTYLPLRAVSDGCFVFLQKPDTWGGFWWTVLRMGYSTDENPAVALYGRQAMELFKEINANFGFIWIFAVPGAYILWKKQRYALGLYGAVFILISTAVILVNRTPGEVMWVIDIFLMPAIFVFALLIINGIAFILKAEKLKAAAPYILGAVMIAAVYDGYGNYIRNDGSRNYLSYDFARNISKTMPGAGFYLPEGDIYNMASGYLRFIGFNGDKAGYFDLMSITYKWGKDDFRKKSGVELTGRDNEGNILRVIENFGTEGNIYLSGYSDILGKYAAGCAQNACGLLYRVSCPGQAPETYLFDIYSYRGIFSERDPYDIRLCRLYGERIAAHAVECYNSGNIPEAVKLYKKALIFPADGNKARSIIYYDMSLSYKRSGDRADEIQCLKNSVSFDSSNREALNAIGSSGY